MGEVSEGMVIDILWAGKEIFTPDCVHIRVILQKLYQMKQADYALTATTAFELIIFMEGLHVSYVKTHSYICQTFKSQQTLPAYILCEEYKENKIKEQWIDL